MIKINKKIIVMGIMAFIFAYFSGGNLPYSIFYIFLITILISVAYVRTANKYIHAKFKYEGRFYSVSDTTTVSIIVENQGLVPTSYVYVESSALRELIYGYEGDLINLGINNNTWITNEIKFKKRGVYDFGNIVIQSDDLFSILKLTKNIYNKLEIFVYPKVYDLINVNLNGRHSYENLINSKSGIDDYTLIKDIRKYNIGDNLKKVHWKLTAKHGEMYVKNYDSISGKECNLIINMHSNNLVDALDQNVEEQMVDFSVSLTKYMMNSRIKTRLFVHAKEPKNIEVEFKEDFLGVMEYFLKSKSDATTSFSNFIKVNLRHIPKGNWIGIISIAVDDDLRDVLISLKEMGYKVNVFYYENPLYELKNISLLKKLGIECIHYKEIIGGR